LNEHPQQYTGYPPPQIERKTSRLGRASFMIALGIFLLVIASLVVMLLFSLTGSKAANTIVGISLVGWIFAPAGHLVGLILGIVDVCRKNSKKLTPILGIVGNAVLGGTGLALLVIVGNMMMQSLGAFR
jgi:hypothetical protein